MFLRAEMILRRAVLDRKDLPYAAEAVFGAIVFAIIIVFAIEGTKMSRADIKDTQASTYQIVMTMKLGRSLI